MKSLLLIAVIGVGALAGVLGQFYVAGLKQPDMPYASGKPLKSVLDRIAAKSLSQKPLSPCTQGERGWGEEVGFPRILAPHPQPLSPEHRGEGGLWDRLLVRMGMTAILRAWEDALILIRFDYNRRRRKCKGCLKESSRLHRARIASFHTLFA
jgi:hypothetical protein